MAVPYLIDDRAALDNRTWIGHKQAQQIELFTSEQHGQAEGRNFSLTQIQHELPVSQDLTSLLVRLSSSSGRGSTC